MTSEFVYDKVHRVVVCRTCRTCILPGRQCIERHLRAEPHRLLGPTLKTSLEHLLGLELLPRQELQKRKPPSGVARIEHLEVYHGYYCLLCEDSGVFCTIHLP